MVVVVVVVVWWVVGPPGGDERGPGRHGLPVLLGGHRHRLRRTDGAARAGLLVPGPALVSPVPVAARTGGGSAREEWLVVVSRLGCVCCWHRTPAGRGVVGLHVLAVLCWHSSERLLFGFAVNCQPAAGQLGRRRWPPGVRVDRHCPAIAAPSAPVVKARRATRRVPPESGAATAWADAGRAWRGSRSLTARLRRRIAKRVCAVGCPRGSCGAGIAPAVPDREVRVARSA